MEYKDFSFKELINYAERRKLVLPNFQRDFVWKIQNQRYLIASFLVNLPIGNFLILRGEGEDDSKFHSKVLCFDESITPEGDCYYLLDGQQRLSTIKNVFTDHLSHNDWGKNISSLHHNLKYRWFLSLSEEGDDSDFLGFENLRFEEEVHDKDGHLSPIPIPLTKEPSEIANSIVCHRVLKTKDKDEFYHPGKYANTDLSDYDIKIKFAQDFASKNYLPLLVCPPIIRTFYRPVIE